VVASTAVPTWYNGCMLALVAASLTAISYGFRPTPPLAYDVAFDLKGFLPLLGGLEGEAHVGLGFQVAGAPADTDGNPRVACELKAFKLSLDGDELPFTLDQVKDWFPPNASTITPQGKLVKNDLPDREVPFRLPGLDVKRLPDLSFLPVEFPIEGVEVGKEWTFKKAFGDTEVSYSAKVTVLDDAHADIELKLSQSYDTLEDVANKVVKTEQEAATRVHTDMTGTGKATFDRKLGVVRSCEIDAHSVGHAVDLKTKKESDRKLDMTVKTNLRKNPF